MKTSNFILIIVVLILTITSLFAQVNHYQMIPHQASWIFNADHLNSKIVFNNDHYYFQTTTLDGEVIEIIQIDKMDPNNSQLVYSNYDNSFHIGMQDSFLITLRFDQPNPRFQLINEDFFVSYSDWHSFGPVIKIDDNTFQVSVPQGYYHLWARFEDLGHRIVFRDSMHFVSDSSITISSSEAIHRIYFEAVNENGELLANLSGDEDNVGYSVVYKDSARSASSSTNIFEDYITVSDMNGPFFISSLQFQQERGDPNILRAVRFTLRNILTDITLSNDPGDFLMQNLKVVFPDDATSRMIVIWGTTRTNPYGGFSGSGGGYRVDKSEWTGKLYINSEPDENVVKSVRISAELPDINDPFPFDKEYIRMPSFRVVENQIGSFLGQSPSVVDYLSPDGGELVYGVAPIFASGLHLNNLESQNQIGCYNRIYGPLNEQRNYDMQNAHISIYDSSGVELVSTLQSEFVPYETEAGKYQTEIICDNYQVGEIDGRGTLRAWYDLREDDPNPPVFTSFRIIDSQGKPVYNLNNEQHYAIQFSAADFLLADTMSNDYDWKHLKYRSILKDSTRIWIKGHDSIQWQPLPVQVVLEDLIQDRIVGATSAEFMGLVYYFPKGVLYNAALDSLDLDSTAIDIKVSVMDKSGNRTEWILEPACILGNYNPTVVIESDVNILPQKFSLHQNYPNPFNPSTRIKFDLPKPENVKIEVYNIIGQKVETLLNKPLPAGYHEVEFNGHNLSSGVYLYRIEAGEFQDVKKMILIK